MRTIVLGKTELEVSAVGFGGIPIQRLPTDEAVQTIRSALELGVTFIDTAAAYGDSEEKIGPAIEDRCDGVVIATKSGRTDGDGLREELENSLEMLRTDTIDLYQLHCVSSEEKWTKMRKAGGALPAALKARDEGLIKHFGVTSHSLDLALALVDVPEFETIQFPFNLVTSEPADELIPAARDQNLGFIVMKPLCGGQYRNATFAFKFLNQYPDLVPIPGIEKVAEIQEIVRIVDSGETLQGREKEEAMETASRLGKRFCRRCGYCMPCPQGVPIQTAMTFDSLIERLPPERLLSGPATRLAQKAVECVECGECQEKCPYNLPIIDTVQKNLEKARKILE
ncbi:MAG: aldo/keto reductase [Candidatus Brocadiia bacterium]